MHIFKVIYLYIQNWSTKFKACKYQKNHPLTCHYSHVEFKMFKTVYLFAIFLHPTFLCVNIKTHVSLKSNVSAETGRRENRHWSWTYINLLMSQDLFIHCIVLCTPETFLLQQYNGLNFVCRVLFVKQSEKCLSPAGYRFTTYAKLKLTHTFNALILYKTSHLYPIELHFSSLAPILLNYVFYFFWRD